MQLMIKLESQKEVWSEGYMPPGKKLLKDN